MDVLAFVNRRRNYVRCNKQRCSIIHRLDLKNVPVQCLVVNEAVLRFGCCCGWLLGWKRVVCCWRVYEGYFFSAFEQMSRNCLQTVWYLIEQEEKKKEKRQK